MTDLAVSYQQFKNEFTPAGVTLVAVSKIQPVEKIRKLYELGHRDFGENYVQELVEKSGLLPADIQWHFIGHLQSNKVKFILPITHLIQGVDSLKLLQEINKQAAKAGIVAQCLLQVFIATEDTKFGLDENELKDILTGGVAAGLTSINIRGLMGMASFTDDQQLLQRELAHLKKLFEQYKADYFSDNGEPILSMGMSGDYKVAIEQGSNMVRIGSLLFGARMKTQ